MKTLLSFTFILIITSFSANAGLFGMGDPKEIPAEKVRMDVAGKQAGKYFDSSSLKILRNLPSSQGVFIPGFRVQFAMSGEASAHTAGSTSSSTTQGVGGTLFTTLTSTSAQNVKLEVSLTGIEKNDLQAITDRLYKDFLHELKATGVNVVDVSHMPEYEKLETTSVPYIDDVSIERSTVKMHMFSPTGMPLWFLHGEGDKGAFSLSNYRVIGKLSYENNLVAVIPQITISFMKIKSSGNSIWFSTKASVDLEQAVFVPYQYTFLKLIYQDQPVAASASTAFINEIFTVPGKLGQASDVTSEEIKDSESLANAVSGTLSLLGKLSGINTSGVSRSTKQMAIQTNPETFSKIALDAGETTGKLFAAIIADYGKGTGIAPAKGTRKTMTVSEALGNSANSSSPEDDNPLDF